MFESKQLILNQNNLLQGGALVGMDFLEETGDLGGIFAAGWRIGWYGLFRGNRGFRGYTERLEIQFFQSSIHMDSLAKRIIIELLLEQEDYPFPHLSSIQQGI